MAGPAGRPATLRPQARSALADAPAATEPAGARALALDAPHRLGWLVQWRAGARTEPAVQCLCSWAALAVSRIAPAVRGLCLLATAVVTRRSAGAPGALLDPAAGRRDALAAAHRPPAPRRADLPWSAPALPPAGVAQPGAQPAEPARRGDAVHDPVGRLPGVAG